MPRKKAPRVEPVPQAPPQPTNVNGLTNDVLTLAEAAAYLKAGVNESLSRIVVGMHDYGSGLDMDSFEMIADFKVNGVESGKDLASLFKPKTVGVWELVLTDPAGVGKSANLKVSLKDRQGNASRIERDFSIGR